MEMLKQKYFDELQERYPQIKQFLQYDPKEEKLIILDRATLEKYNMESMFAAVVNDLINERFKNWKLQNLKEP